MLITFDTASIKVFVALCVKAIRIFFDPGGTQAVGLDPF